MANVSNLHQTDPVASQNELTNTSSNNSKHTHKNNYVQNPPKRAKLDAMGTTLERYMKRRNYNYKVENDRIILPQDAYLEESTDESIAISRATMNNNSVVFSYVNIDTNTLDILDQQFTRLQNFIQSLRNSAIKEELITIIPVLLCHLYLEILKGIDKSAAVNFLEKHFPTFLQTEANPEGHYELLTQLKSIVTVQDIESQPLLSLFRSSKHITYVSTETATTLRRFLSKHGHSIILHILNKWFHYVLKTPHMETFEVIEKHIENEAPVVNTETEEPQSYLDDFSELVANMKKINLTRVTNLLNAERVTCAVSDYYTSAKAVGLKNSEIVLVRNNLDYIQLEPESSDDRLEVQYIRGHGNSVTDIKFTQEGSLMLSSSQDDTVRLWSMSNGKCLNIYTGHQYPIWSLAMAPNGQYFATGSFDNTARLWCLERRHPFRIFTGHSESVQSVAFHKNGKYVATGSRDATVRLFSISDGSVLRLMSEPAAPIYCVEFSPDGKLLAGAGEDGFVYIWDLANGSCLYQLEGHSGTICCMTWATDANQLKLYTGTINGEIKLWTKRDENWQSNDLYNEGNYRRIMNVEISPIHNGLHIFALPTDGNRF